MLTLHTNKKGFTLIELLVVVAIIGLLSSIVLTNVATAKEKAETTTAQVESTQLRNAILEYRTDNREYPPNLYTGCPSQGLGWDLVMDDLISGGYLNNAYDLSPLDHLHGPCQLTSETISNATYRCGNVNATTDTFYFASKKDMHGQFPALTRNSDDQQLTSGTVGDYWCFYSSIN